MKDKKLACFSITGELLLDILKEKTDLPEDAQLVLVAEKKGGLIKDKKVKAFMETKFPEGQKNDNVITFIITSKEFWKVADDCAIPIVYPKAK